MLHYTMKVIMQKKKRDYTITFNFHEDEHLWWLIIY